ncbi:MAG: CDP-glycerol glycerophosphotransferase family protein [Chitinophagaceae bacterium]
MGFFSEYRQVNQLLKEKQKLVFYAESRHYYPYFGQLLHDLLAAHVPVCYITSDPRDPLLAEHPAGMNVIYVKWMLGTLFSRLRADTLVMTMPDLGNYLFKRSPGVKNFVYVFHAAVSTHQQYRKEAFTNYDTIFCTGEYQQIELRKAEELYGQHPKNLVEYGYPLLDEIKNKTANREPGKTGKPILLVAPSWFEGCIFDTCIEKLLEQLSTLPYTIILRSHPEYEKRKKKSFKAVRQLISRYPDMSIDDLPNVIDRLPSTDILITDRSGIAFEFAFGTGRPVLFIDTALKETNPSWKELGIEPLENRLRDQLGVTISTSALQQVSQKIRELEQLQQGFAAKMDQLKPGIFYNSGASYKKGLDMILHHLKD